MPIFEAHLRAAIASARIPPRVLSEKECQTSNGRVCHLCNAAQLNYDDELRVKNQALSSFWKEGRLQPLCDPLKPSPYGRAYRTVTKRKVFHNNRGIQLALINPTDRGRMPVRVGECVIEPTGHNRLYAHIEQALNTPRLSRLAKVLSYVIIKGDYEEQLVILNIEAPPDTPKLVSALSKSITERVPSVKGVFLFEGKPDDEYYLGSKHGSPEQHLRKIHGKTGLHVDLGERRFSYSVASFTQVNHSAIKHLVDIARTMLRPDADAQLFDLYCGYGLFSLSFAADAQRVLGFDGSRSSINDAIENTRKMRINNARFQCVNLTKETTRNALRTMKPGDLVLLDPPRNGTAHDVIEEIAAHAPARVVHLFCNIDGLPDEMLRWKRSGYAMKRAVPVDMFPGTFEVEVVTLLERVPA